MDHFKPAPQKPKNLQTHSFFSFPTIFFGIHQISEEEWICENDDWNFSDPWHISTNQNLVAHHQHKIGIFILWSESEEENDSIEN
jgi:hypothetical protein